MAGENCSSVESLLERLRRGPADDDAWTSLHRLMLPQVLLWARRALGDRPAWSEAEDVAQEVFTNLAVVTRAGRLELPATEHGIYSLLAVMTRNRATDIRRRERRQARDASRRRPMPEEIAAPIEPDAIEVRDLLEHLLASLDRFDQRLLWMRLDGLTHDEIASRLNISGKTVQRHFGRISQVYNQLRDAKG